MIMSAIRSVSSRPAALGALAAALFLCLALFPAGAQDFEEMDRVIEDAMAKHRVPGVAIGIVTSEETLYLKGYGVAKAGEADRVDENTIFAVGSNGKSFTSVMIGALQDEGMLDFNDRIKDRLPGFTLRDLAAGDKLTFKDALGHLSGLPEQATLGSWYLLGADGKQVVEIVGATAPAAALRERFAYNNAMFTVAAEAASHVTGKPYDVLVEKYVFKPLGMSRSSTDVPPARQRNVASPHDYENGEPAPVPYHAIRGAYAAGSVNSTAKDMSRFVQMMLNGGRGPGGNAVLTPETSADIQQLRHAFVDGEMSSIGQLFALLDDPSTVKSFGYGLGVGHLIYNGSAYYLHGGAIDGMTSWMMWSPEDDIGVVVLSNSGNFLFPALASFTAINPLIGLPRGEALDRAAAMVELVIAAPEPPQAEVAMPALVGGEALAGTYENVNGAFDIENRDAGPVFRAVKTGYGGPLKHVNGPYYWVEWENPAIGALMFEVQTSPAGAVTGLREVPHEGARFFASDPLFLRLADQ